MLTVDVPAPGVATVTLNRPAKRNALCKDLLSQLADAMGTLATDPAVRVVILTGADPAFCAGVDMIEVADPDISFGRDDLRAVRDFPLPIIGAINGPAATGGLELALASDFRIASDRATFADTHARVGGVPAWGLTARLPQAVGQAWARQMSFTGQFIDAQTAFRIGLVNEIVPHAELLPRATAIASDIVATAAPAVARIRESFDRGRDGTAADSLEHEILPGTQLMSGRDEFIERRKGILGR